jgi:hypothetical protein
MWIEIAVVVMTPTYTGRRSAAKMSDTLVKFDTTSDLRRCID